MTDRTISHYRILEPLGEGGMGVVYKAEDTRLKRIVALKFLSKDVTGTGEHSDRFLREAQAAAALDHPNICTLYEIDEQDGETFLAMAFLEGQPLDARILEGPLRLEQACEIARQAAEGLSAAHEAGIIHRDIKAANIMLSNDPKGRVVAKLMDFGLAQVSGVSRLTKVDTRMGTVAYMSPEQALGEEIGPLTDLWSLGVVLYEMVAGDLPFRGHYDQAVLYSILNEEPEPITALRSRVPMELEWIIEKCLAKSPLDRYPDVRALVSDLELLQRRLATGRTTMHVVSASVPSRPDASRGSEGISLPPAPEPETAGQVGSSQKTTLSAPTASAKLPSGRRGLLALAACTVVAFVLGLLLPVGGEEEAPRLRRFTTRPVEALTADAAIRQLAISPDGQVIGFTTSGPDSALWLHALDRHEPFRVAGTEGARDVFWSPDSEFVGFSNRLGIGKVSLRGMAVTMLIEDDTLAHTNATWSADGQSIYYNPLGGATMAVSALGGIPRPLFEASPRRRSLVGSLSTIGLETGGELLLYSERTMDGDSVMVRPLVGEGSSEGMQVALGYSPVYSETGHILFQPETMESALWAVPFSPKDLTTLGEPFAVAQDAREPSVSSDGTLVYLHSPNSRQMRLAWFNREGERIGEAGRSQPWIMSPRVSPSGQSVLVSASSGRTFDLWVHGADREVVSRLTFDGSSEIGSIWSPDSRSVAFVERGSRDLKVLAVGEGSPPRTIYSFERSALDVLDWSGDGRFILVQLRRFRGGDRPPGGPSGKAGWIGTDRSPDTSIAYLEQSGDGWELREFLPAGPFIVDDAVFSPDGRYVAYESNELGDFDIYVKPFPEGSQRWQVTTEGGRLPRWGEDGEALYFLDDDTLFEIGVDPRNAIGFSEPQRLFSRDGLAGLRRHSTYDVGDGGRFVLAEPLAEANTTAIRIVLNWLSEFVAR